MREKGLSHRIEAAAENRRGCALLPASWDNNMAGRTTITSELGHGCVVVKLGIVCYCSSPWSCGATSHANTLSGRVHCPAPPGLKQPSVAHKSTPHPSSNHDMQVLMFATISVTRHRHSTTVPMEHDDRGVAEQRFYRIVQHTTRVTNPPFLVANTTLRNYLA